MTEPDLEKEVRKRGIECLPPWQTEGMKRITGYYEAAENAPYPDDSRDALTVLFETGCRRGEATTIKASQARVNDEAIILYRVPVLKKKTKATRDIWIRRDAADPLADRLAELIEARGPDGYLLPGYAPFTHSHIPGRGCSPRTVYNRVSEISPDLFPHALRSYRAGFLVWERGFDLRDLVQWFKWESQAGIEMALHYTSQVDMAKKLGIRRVPT
jgi:integrase